MTEAQLTPVFCLVGDFCKSILPEFRKRLIGDGKNYGLEKTACQSQKSLQF